MIGAAPNNDKLNGKLCGVWESVEHSKSPDIHHQFAEQTQQAMRYRKQLVAIDAFEITAQEFLIKADRDSTLPCRLSLPPIILPRN